MPIPSPSGDRGSLERLCGDEAELERGLAEARRAAASLLADARGDAERIVSEARKELAQALARFRAETEELAVREAGRAKEAVGADAAALASRAERNRPRTLARLVEIVLGRGPP